MQKQTLQQNFRNYKNAKNTQYHCRRKSINKALNQIMNKKKQIGEPYKEEEHRKQMKIYTRKE